MINYDILLLKAYEIQREAPIYEFIINKLTMKREVDEQDIRNKLNELGDYYAVLSISLPIDGDYTYYEGSKFIRHGVLVIDYSSTTGKLLGCQIAVSLKNQGLKL